jgi:hypothetical protein
VGRAAAPAISYPTQPNGHFFVGAILNRQNLVICSPAFGPHERHHLRLALRQILNL